MLLAIPSKGRLQEPTLRLLEAVGIKPLASDERALVLPTSWNDVNIIKARPEDIPYLVDSGRIWAGITGHDYIIESGSNVVEVLDLEFGKGKLVVAVPKTSGIKSIDELPPGARVATKFVNIAYNYFAELGKRVRIVRVAGSVEILPQLGIADAILDVMATGTTLEIHGLTPIATVLETSARLIVHPNYVNHELTKKLVTFIKGYYAAQGRKMIFLNVPATKLEDVLSILPAMEAPSVTKLAKGDVYEVFSVVPEDILPDLVMKLKNAGAKDIVVTSIEKLIS
ncbi:ATP phosphoribosyltransferase (homohexameric) [Pyrobaculum islandicum DSM 4184]|uniref:ATP phosphoribosyltransferase n=1 Tax=Pyrobaculum islandicum (strain DSM 4184 / JCM 9189 / GEO3) TaxID=384616 RepID=HIS1_PYRIL|nr:ATP phosphoribosyltransferase [Pyrobaculum islandicum]A1RTU8.1 RecName: Full=ATP phosphoribosyltransferase; Short=ATP-PRT; Short=ATP-PRTase [Pyrobaculum islandicum DSM 4184]ABL88380.1 ATP phosphoribosyltransferase (homohexameric) [Pyrobaculum islandicum DSM 4184]